MQRQNLQQGRCFLRLEAVSGLTDILILMYNSRCKVKMIMKVLKRTVSCPVISERDLYGVKILMFRLTEYHLGAALIRHGDSVIIT